jgi:putative acetyltransferase
MDEVLVREETPEDVRAIDVVNLSAFEGETEAKFVTAIRKSAAYVPELALVAEINGRIVGHILLSVVTLVGRAGEKKILALGPMSVVPSQSHRGIGTALVRAALTKAGSLGYAGIVVVGHPDFYKRLGFESASKWGIGCGLPVADTLVTAKELVSGGFGGGGTVRFPELFSDLYAPRA